MIDLSCLVTRFSRTFYLCAAVLYMAAIFISSSLELPIEETSYPFLLSFCANLFHFPLYTGLGLLLLLGLRTASTRDNLLSLTRTVVPSLIILVSYGALDEYHQSFTGRTPSFIDLCTDLCGGIAAVLLLKLALEKTMNIPRFVVLFLCTGLAACGLAYLAVSL